jgi:hypothetical protein
MTQAIDYMLSSSDSNIVANFLFKDDLLYSLSLSIINGSVAKVQYANLTAAARDFLVKYQTFSGINSSDLILTLEKFDPAQDTSVTVGDVRFWISHFAIPNVANTTTFRWLYADNTSISLDFYDDFHGNKEVFGGFHDYRQFPSDTVTVAPAISCEAQNVVKNS